jgi:hypothetical protein
MAQVVECLPSKCKAVSSNPNTAKKKKWHPNSPKFLGIPSIKQNREMRQKFTPPYK